MDPSNDTGVTENDAVDTVPVGRLTTIDPKKAGATMAAVTTQPEPGEAISSRKSLFGEGYDPTTILIISIAILGVLFIILVLLIALCWQQRQQRKKLRLAQEIEAAEKDEKRRKRKRRLLRRKHSESPAYGLDELFLARKKSPKKGSSDTTPKTDQKPSPQGGKSNEGQSAEPPAAAQAPQPASDQPPENGDDAGYEMVGKTI
ncbi:hypothetical protein Y032_0087g2017 [Ancylostoma ceylanicum]|uniref:Uncharacterized protein n=1 Tax=Ancylostoma ceylanicum TaxID=53326 RepID=A0A016TP18_9BILA|nr:hypothetical protein Y032_0087g2017 [Ancylostoma ceylanicum]